MPLHDEIVEKLRDMISEGELLPGRAVLKGLLVPVSEAES
jgi:hypothetical protein